MPSTRSRITTRSTRSGWCAASRCASISINVVEFDPINSLHLHGNFFDYYDHGTTLTPTLRTVDTVMQCQAQRGILEFTYKDHETGLYMFHAHQSEFTELGWMGMFDVVEAAGMNDALARSAMLRSQSRCGPVARHATDLDRPAALRSRARGGMAGHRRSARAFNNGAPPVEKLTFERRSSMRWHPSPRARRRLGADDDRPGAGRRRLLDLHAGSARRLGRLRRPGSTFRFPGCWARRIRSRSSPRRARPSITRSRSPCRPGGRTSNQLVPQALVGAFVGILPVAIGLMFYPALRGLGRRA